MGLLEQYMCILSQMPSLTTLVVDGGRHFAKDQSSIVPYTPHDILPLSKLTGVEIIVHFDSVIITTRKELETFIDLLHSISLKELIIKLRAPIEDDDDDDDCPRLLTVDDLKMFLPFPVTKIYLEALGIRYGKFDKFINVLKQFSTAELIIDSLIDDEECMDQTQENEKDDDEEYNYNYDEDDDEDVEDDDDDGENDDEDVDYTNYTYTFHPRDLEKMVENDLRVTHVSSRCFQMYGMLPCYLEVLEQMLYLKSFELHRWYYCEGMEHFNCLVSSSVRSLPLVNCHLGAKYLDMNNNIDAIVAGLCEMHSLKKLVIYTGNLLYYNNEFKEEKEEKAGDEYRRYHLEDAVKEKLKCFPVHFTDDVNDY